MNFEDAIRAHAEWKLKLSNYLKYPDDSIDPAKLALDNACVLGQWLHGDGRKYSALDEYEPLVKEHAEFHKAAADIVNRKNSGQDISADIALGGQSKFAQHSMAVINLLMKLKNKV